MAGVDNAHVVGVDVDAAGAVDVAEPDAEVLAAGPAAAQVAVERALDGAVASRRAWCTQVPRLATVDLVHDRDHLRAAVESDVAAVARVLRPLCSHSTRPTQPCIPPGSLDRVPASAGVRAGMSPLPGGR